MLKERFERVVRVKAGIGHPFTMEDVAETLEVPYEELRSAWLLPLINEDVIRNIGSQASRRRAARHRKITIWSGTYYLDLEDEERDDAA